MVVHENSLNIIEVLKTIKCTLKKTIITYEENTTKLVKVWTKRFYALSSIVYENLVKAIVLEGIKCHDSYATSCREKLNCEPFETSASTVLYCSQSDQEDTNDEIIGHRNAYANVGWNPDLQKAISIQHTFNNMRHRSD
ncbi:hypothetical protein KIN20_031447 [Parelaphostrongylus tenuis]|uniref:Uncharacterized protein n=1 Tax=Parelaphostrongylus tenuis TaxID=148309 RepID=A0AAD5WH03_PARTN|nr:hypothetical protein KIN20_031447 [Parelaphostrongylus tenuis]